MNNIIITDPKEADGFTGILIDEDLAKEIGKRTKQDTTSDRDDGVYGNTSVTAGG